MKTWLEVVKAGQAEQQEKLSEIENQKVLEFRARMTPVVDRLKKFVATIPESERYPRSITFFTEALKPRWNGKHAAARDIADALRRLGFSRNRAWNKPEAGFRSHWHFPETTTTKGEK